MTNDIAQRLVSLPGHRALWLSVTAAIVIGLVSAGTTAALGQQESGDDVASTITPPAASEGASTESEEIDGRFPIVAYQSAAALGAEELDFAELLGNGMPVVLNFWAGQCPPCRAEMPALQNVYDAYGEDFLLVGVDIGPYIGLGSSQSAIDLLVELGITYPTAGAVDGRAVQDHSVLGMPTTIFYDGEGNEVNRQSGMLSEDLLESRVRELLGLTS